MMSPRGSSPIEKKKGETRREASVPGFARPMGRRRFFEFVAGEGRGSSVRKENLPLYIKKKKKEFS